METEIFAAFLVASFVLAITPGPDLILLTSITASGGFRNGCRCALGIFMSGLLLTAAVALGLGEILKSMPTIAYGIRVVGAIYFAWLAAVFLRGWWRGIRHVSEIDKSDIPHRPSVSPAVAGLVNNLLNPKALLFFGLFLPQFISPAGWDVSLQLAILGVVLSATALLVNLAICIVAARAVSGVANTANPWVEGVAGLFFVFLAYRLARTPAAA